MPLAQYTCLVASIVCLHYIGGRQRIAPVCSASAIDCSSAVRPGVSASLNSAARPAHRTLLCVVVAHSQLACATMEEILAPCEPSVVQPPQHGDKGAVSENPPHEVDSIPEVTDNPEEALKEKQAAMDRFACAAASTTEQPNAKHDPSSPCSAARPAVAPQLKILDAPHLECWLDRDPSPDSATSQTERAGLVDWLCRIGSEKADPWDELWAERPWKVPRTTHSLPSCSSPFPKKTQLGHK